MKINLKNILWAVVFFLVVLAWLFGLFIDLTGDSGLYAAISRQMVESGNWLDLKINSEPYDQKPHLVFWLAGLGIHLFGTTNFAFKIFPFLFGILGIYFTYRLARLLYSETAGKLAALFTGTSQLFFLYFLDIHTDTVLQSAVILSLWQLAAYLKHKKQVHFVLAFTGIGLALLTKGPVGGVLPFFFVLFYLVLKKDFRQLFHFKWLAGIALVLMIILPTLYHLWSNFGTEGLRFYFIDNNIGRVSGAVAGSSTDPFFYLYNLLWAFLPWTLPVFTGLVLEIKSWVNGRNFHLQGASLLGSVLVLFVVYSVARGKAPNYLMILMPPMAVVAAGRVQHALKIKSNRIITALWFHIAILVLLLLLLIVIWYVIKPGDSFLWLFVLNAVVAILVMLFFNYEPSLFQRIVFVSVLVTAAFNLYLNKSILPSLFKFQGSRQVLEVLEKDGFKGENLYVFELEEYEIYFYAKDVRAVNDWEHFFEVLEISGTWIYTNEIKYTDLINLEYEFEKIYIIEQRGMNEINLNFLIHSKRTNTLTNNYLLKVR